MNTNYQIGSIVRTKIMSINITGRIVNKIKTIGGFEYWVEFFNGHQGFVSFNEKGVCQSLSHYSQLEVIGHVGQDIAIEFANYCISEGFGTDARPQDFQKFLETYKPQNNG